MATYYICADANDGGEKALINQAVEQIRSHNLQAEAGSVGPNTIQSYGQSSESAGKIGVFIVNGKAGETHVDFSEEVRKGGYHYVQMYMLGAYEFNHNKNLRPESMNEPYGHEPGANNKYTDKYVGKTPSQLNMEYPLCQTIFANTLHECVEQMLNGVAPSVGSSPPQPVSYKEMFKDLLKPLDGDVEIYVRDDECYVHQVPFAEPNFDKFKENEGNGYTYYPPSALIYASEGVNIAHDSLVFTEHNPETYNKLNVVYVDGDTEEIKKIVFKNQSLIDRFGEHEKDMDAVRYIEGVMRESDKEDEGKLKSLKADKDKRKKEEAAKVKDRYSKPVSRDDPNVRLADLEAEKKDLKRQLEKRPNDPLKGMTQDRIKEIDKKIAELKKEIEKAEKEEDAAVLRGGR